MLIYYLTYEPESQWYNCWGFGIVVRVVHHVLNLPEWEPHNNRMGAARSSRAPMQEASRYG